MLVKNMRFGVMQRGVFGSDDDLRARFSELMEQARVLDEEERRRGEQPEPADHGRVDGARPQQRLRDGVSTLNRQLRSRPVDPARSFGAARPVETRRGSRAERRAD